MQDGSFVLIVNGKTVINRGDVLYRLAGGSSDGGSADDGGSVSGRKKKTKSTKGVQSTPTPDSSDDDLGLLGNLLQRFGPRGVGHDRMVSIPVTADLVPTSGESSLQPTISSHPPSNNHQPAPTTTASLNTVHSRSSNDGQFGFQGIFFR